jgi:uncharacterized protein YukE
MNKHLQNQLGKNPTKVSFPQPPLSTNGNRTMLRLGKWTNLMTVEHQKQRFDANKTLANIDKDLEYLGKQRTKIQSEMNKLNAELEKKGKTIANAKDPLKEAEVSAFKKQQLLDLESAFEHLNSQIMTANIQAEDAASIVYDKEYLTCYSALDDCKKMITHYQDILDKITKRLDEKDKELAGKFVEYEAPAKSAYDLQTEKLFAKDIEEALNDSD